MKREEKKGKSILSPRRCLLSTFSARPNKVICRRKYRVPIKALICIELLPVLLAHQSLSPCIVVVVVLYCVCARAPISCARTYHFRIIMQSIRIAMAAGSTRIGEIKSFDREPEFHSDTTSLNRKKMLMRVCWILIFVEWNGRGKRRKKKRKKMEFVPSSIERWLVRSWVSWIMAQQKMENGQLWGKRNEKKIYGCLARTQRIPLHRMTVRNEAIRCCDGGKHGH